MLTLIVICLIIVTLIYYKDKTKITKELEKIEKENGEFYINKKKKK